MRLYVLHLSCFLECSNVSRVLHLNTIAACMQFQLVIGSVQLSMFGFGLVWLGVIMEVEVIRLSGGTHSFICFLVRKFQNNNDIHFKTVA